METCPQHSELVSKVAVLETKLDGIKDSQERVEKIFCKHVDEGEKTGGFRDRLIVVEQSISTIKKSYWKTCIVSGVIGGLLGKLSPDLFNFLLKLAFARQ